MIRKMQNIDINRVADIWLKTNLKAHDFIPEQYWTSNYMTKLNIKMTQECMIRQLPKKMVIIAMTTAFTFQLKT